MLVGVGLAVYELFIEPSQAIYRIPNDTVTVSDDKPDERPVSPDAEYNVPADHPRRIIMDRLEINGFVQPVGVDQHGAIAVSSNIHIAGWFVDRAAPGESGLSIIDGHVRGWTSSGVFERLNEMVPGDRFQVEMGDLSIREFEVMESRTVSAPDADTALFERSVEGQLNLITCTGPYNEKIDGYEQRQIIYARFAP